MSNNCTRNTYNKLINIPINSFHAVARKLLSKSIVLLLSSPKSLLPIGNDHCYCELEVKYSKLVHTQHVTF